MAEKINLNSAKDDRQILSIFNVFTEDIAGGVDCRGNPAVVVLVNSLPSLSAHLDFLQQLSRVDREQWATVKLMTFAYIKSDIILNRELNTNTHEYLIRWFSSTSVIQRCGHGTLAAAAYVMKYCLEEHLPMKNTSTFMLKFHSDSEVLTVKVVKKRSSVEIDSSFFILQLRQVLLVKSAEELYLNTEVYRLKENKTQENDGYLIVELGCENEVTGFKLSKNTIATIAKRALIITAVAKNERFDIIFRYFAPFYGQLEDDATGSAASVLSSFWEAHPRSGQLRCFQASQSGGFFTIRNNVGIAYLPNKLNAIEVIGCVKLATADS